MARSTPMDRESAARISAAANRDPDSPTATSGLAERPQAAADRNEPQQLYDYDDEIE